MLGWEGGEAEGAGGWGRKVKGGYGGRAKDEEYNLPFIGSDTVYV